MSFNNDDNSLTAVRFREPVGWVYNINQSFTTLRDIDQTPLKFIKRPTNFPTPTATATPSVTSSVTTLHIHVDQHRNFLHSFPPGTTKDVIARRNDAKGLFSLG
jgi:hypothetical protein